MPAANCALVTVTLAALAGGIVVGWAMLFQPMNQQPKKFTALDREPRSIDCKRTVTPIDPAPIRSPQEIHSILAQRFVGKDIAEIGTRNGDGMDCFARVAKSAVAIEMNPEYCRKLEARAQQLRDHGHRSYSVACRMYQQETPVADVYTWWEQPPHLRDADLLDELVLLFDHKYEPDMRSWAVVKHVATWQQDVSFDERGLCHKLLPKKHPERFWCKTRSFGNFTVAAVPLSAWGNLDPVLRARTRGRKKSQSD